MTAKEVLAQLKEMGHGYIKKIYTAHGVTAEMYGVKIGDMKKIQKVVRKDYTLSLELYDSGVSDAQYFAGLIADEKRMTKKDLQHWAESAVSHMQNEYTVPWIAAESAHGWELALEWIDDERESIQSSGWNTLASLVGIKPDEELDIKGLRKLLKRVEKEIPSAGNRVRYCMNSFVIAVGGYVKELSAEAIAIAKSLGKITVDMGDTSCKVPYAPDYIKKMLDRGVKKKKMARC
jgi:3-methyladenine DNA glycosylase AlkD